MTKAKDLPPSPMGTPLEGRPETKLHLCQHKAGVSLYLDTKPNMTFPGRNRPLAARRFQHQHHSNIPGLSSQGTTFI